MAFSVQDALTAIKWKVNSLGDGMVQIARRALEETGYLVPVLESHDGSSGQTTRVLYPPEADADFRQRMAIDQPAFNETFLGSAINTSLWQAPVTTFTFGVANQRVTFNNGGSVAAGAVGQLRTWSNFPILQAGTLYGEAVTIPTVAPTPGVEVLWGFGLASGVADPTDGAYFRQVDNDVFQGICVTPVGPLTVNLDATNLPGVQERAHWAVQVDPDQVRFWKNDILLGTINTFEKIGGNAVPNTTTLSSLPFFMRVRNVTAPGLAYKVDLTNVSVSTSGFDNNRLYPTIQAQRGMGAYQAYTGSTPGQTAQWVNSATPASAALSNTAAGYTTLGGLFQFAAVAGAETDYALFAFQCPAVHGKGILLKGITIETWVAGVAVATTATVLQWGVSVGASAVSLATAEAATTKAPRRSFMGTQYFAVGAPVGQDAKRISINLDAAIVVHSGEFIHIILRVPVGTATASQLFRGGVFVNAVWID